MNIAIYISNHGFGHATRMIALAEEFTKRGIFCHIVTDRPLFLFSKLNNQYFDVYKRAIDFGLIHKNWHEPDIVETERKLIDLWKRKDKLIDIERNFLKENKINLVIADIPPLAIEAGKDMELPVVAISNFDWYFMYDRMLSDNADVRSIIEKIKTIYNKADLAIKLPFSSDESMGVYNNILELGLLAQKSGKDSGEIRKQYGIKDNQRIVLVSFGGGDANIVNIENLLEVDDIVVFSRCEQIIHDRFIKVDENTDFSSLIVASDIMMTKLGYSTLAECVQAGTFIIYTDRDDFAEDDILEKGLADYSSKAYFPYKDFPDMDWKEVFAKIIFNSNDKIRNRNQSIACKCIEAYSSSPEDKNVIIDVGTNNILVLWASGATIIHRASVIAGLGKGMKDSMLAKDSLNKTKQLLSNFIELSVAFSKNITITGTSCSREAKNINQLSSWLKNKYDIDYRVLSGKEEAYYNGLSVIGEFNYNQMLSFDIGGGSTEFTLIKNGRVVNSISLRVGLRRFESMFNDDYAEMINHLKKELYKVPKADFKCINLVGIGGTVASLGAIKKGLKRYKSEVVHRSILTIDDVEFFIDRFRLMNDSEIAELMPFEPMRSSIICIGAMVIKEIMRYFDCLSFEISDKGLQFGILTELLQ